jgi:hypothetical protein
MNTDIVFQTAWNYTKQGKKKKKTELSMDIQLIYLRARAIENKNFYLYKILF